MIPLIERIREYISITLLLDDIDGERIKTYWAKTTEEIPAIVERHSSKIEGYQNIFLKS